MLKETKIPKKKHTQEHAFKMSNEEFPKKKLWFKRNLGKAQVKLNVSQLYL